MNIMALIKVDDFLATGSQDGSIVIWDLETSKKFSLLKGHKVNS